MADAPAAPTATPAAAESTPAPVETPAVTPKPNARKAAQLPDRPQTYERNEATSNRLAKAGKAAAMERLKARKSAGGDDDIDPDTYVDEPAAPPPPKPKAEPESKSRPEAEPGNPPAKDEKPKNLTESTNQALIRRENEVRKREEAAKALEQAATRATKLAELRKSKDYAGMMAELDLNPSELAQYIIDNKDRLGKPTPPPEPEDPRDKRIAELEREAEEGRAYRQQAARQSAVQQAKGILEGVPEFELLNHLGSHEQALAGLYEYFEKHGSIPVEGDEAASLKQIAEKVEADTFESRFGKEFEGMLKLQKVRDRLEKLGFHYREPQPAGQQGPQARAGKQEVTLSNSHSREVPPRLDKADNSAAASKARAVATLKRLRGAEVG